FALIRHAQAPGIGDPENFDLEDCKTQRNLDAAGRAQAERIGQLFRDNGSDRAAIYSSERCRCLETAALLGLGGGTQLPVINSFFRQGDMRRLQTDAAKAWIADADLERPTVLVTHQVNITALTGVYPASGEIVVVRRNASGPLQVVGRIRTE